MDVSKIKRNQGSIGPRFKNSEKSDEKPINDTNQTQGSRGNAVDASTKSIQENNRPLTTVGKPRDPTLSRGPSSNDLTSKSPNQETSTHGDIPVIVCDVIPGGDTPVLSRANSAYLKDNFHLNLNDTPAGQEKTKITDSEVHETQPINAVTAPKSKITPPDRSTSALSSRRGSIHVQSKSSIREHETYVERLAKSRAQSASRHLASDNEESSDSNLTNAYRKDSNASSSLYLSEEDEFMNWNNNRGTKKDAHSLYPSNENYLDPRQRSPSFASTATGSLRIVHSLGQRHPTNTVEFTDADFDSDGDETKKVAVTTEEDIPSLYERACRYEGITASGRISRELANEKVYLDYAGLNKQDIKVVCIALLRHSTITRLDLSGNELCRQAVQYLCELIEENIFITHLFLSCCQLKDSTINALVQTVTTSRNITTLDLSENRLHDEQLELIAKMMKKNGNLRELRLSYCDIDEEGGFILSKALSETTLEVLDLSWNHLRQRGAAAFCLALGDNDGIRELDLSWNGLGREGCAGLEQALPKNTDLIQLNLECNRIGSESLTHLLKGLQRNSNLETLILSTNPLATDDTKLLASSLKAMTNTAIKVVDIFDVTVDDDFVTLQEELEAERGISIYYGNILQRPKKELKAGPRTLDSFDPILVLFEYMKQQNFRLIDLFRSLDLNRDNAISREELRNGFQSLNMHLPEGVFTSAFNKLDLNSNNVIDIDELKNAHRRVIRQTALMMLRKQRQQKKEDQEGTSTDRGSDRVDLLHEFQKLVREATSTRRKITKPGEEESGGVGGLSALDINPGRRMSTRPVPKRRTSTNAKQTVAQKVQSFSNESHSSQENSKGEGRPTRQRSQSPRSPTRVDAGTTMSPRH